MKGTKTKAQLRREALDALGSYQKQGSVHVSPDELADMLADESDRGLIMILVSMLEDLLLLRLIKEFKGLDSPADVKNLTRAGGLLSNFDDRVNLAHALGLLDAEGVEMLQAMKAMRNACAHSRKHIDFTTKQLRDVMILLYEPDSAADIADGSNATALRFAFFGAYVFLAELIIGGDEVRAQEIAERVFQEMANEVIAAAEKRKASRKKRTRPPAKRSRSRPIN